MVREVIVSVVTPTWNRADYLFQLWKSLANQTIQSFEWIVVDDGSTDHTENLIKDLMGKSNFPIVYAKYDKRVGKCRSDNTLLDHASGSFIIWCDSDDYLSLDALEKMLETWKSIPLEMQNSFIGIIALCADFDGNIQSTESTSFHPFICTWHELGAIYRMKGDMCIMQNKRAIGFKRFPEHDLVMSESGFWHQFMGMKVVCLPNILKIMNRDTENRISGSTRMEYCRGKAYAIIYADSNRFHELFFWNQLSLASRYHRYSIHGDLGYNERNQLFLGKKTFAYYVGWVQGTLLAWRDRLQGRVVKSHHIFNEGISAKLTVQRNYLAEELWNSVEYSRDLGNK